MENLGARISEVKERLKRAQRDRTGKILFLRLFDDLVDEIESLLNLSDLKRFDLATRLGVTLAELSSLEEEIYKQRAKESARTAVAVKNEVLETIQFQAVVVNETKAELPAEAADEDRALIMPSGLVVRIVSMSGLKVEVNSLEAALQILREILAVHHRPGDHA